MRLFFAIPLLGFLLALFAFQKSPNASGQAKIIPGKFADATSSLGVNFQHSASHTSKKYLIETMGSGVALFDYGNDGRLDIFLVNGVPLTDPTPKGTIPQKTGPQYGNRLFHQKPDGTFEDVMQKAGLQDPGCGMGVAVGDYDNDGFEDLYVTAYGGNKLYHNNGDGTFTDVTEMAGVAASRWSTSAAWVDLDGNGLLDLVVLRYVQWDFDDIFCGEHREGYRAYCYPDTFQPIAPLVFHNDGNGHFTEISKKIGMDKLGKGLVITDLANQRYALYQNNGDGTFNYSTFTAGLAHITMPHSGWGIRFFAYDNDGWKDLLIAQGHDIDTIQLNYPNLRYRE